MGDVVSVSEPESAVRMTFHTTATAAVPGSTFWVAAHFQIDPGYRIFWVNPGDAGKKTIVHFDVPIGFEASEVLFSAPRTFELPEGKRSFGYEGEAAAFAQVRALPDLHADEMYRFAMEAKWLACKQRCLSESAKAFIEFSVEPDAQQTGFEGSLGDLFAALPQPLYQLAGVEHEWHAGTLSVRSRGGRWLDFLPASARAPRLTKLSIQQEKNELSLSFEGGAEGSRVKGLAVAEGREGPQFVTVDLPYEGPTE